MQGAKWDLSTVPVSKELIYLVKKFDCYDTQQLGQLRNMLNHIGSVANSEHVEIESGSGMSQQMENYLRIVLKLHQILSLVNVDFSDILGRAGDHLEALLRDLSDKGGLDYCQREQSPQGRIFEHAQESTSMINHLKQVDTKGQSQGGVDFAPVLFFDLNSESENKNERVKLSKAYLDLILSSNGAIELYGHAYVWVRYIEKFAELSGKQDQVGADVEFLRLQELAKKPKEASDVMKKFPFQQEQYEKMVDDFGSRKPGIKKIKLIDQLKRYLFVAQMSNDKHQLKLLERILIQLLGYHDMTVRDEAIILLNVFYDGVPWQSDAAFKPVVRCVGQHFKVSLSVSTADPNQSHEQMFIGLSAPSPLSSTHETVLTWHRIAPRNVATNEDGSIEIQINFGKFWKCGFYDWRLVIIDEQGKLRTAQLTKPPKTHAFPMQRQASHKMQSTGYDMSDDELDNLHAQGRFIVHAQGMRDHSFHEMQVDYQNATIDFQNQTFTKRGSFKTIENAIADYKESGVTALYLKGVFQRDNVPVQGNAQYSFGDEGQNQYKRADASCLAVTSRTTPCEMLGGNADFERVVNKAKQHDVKLVVDSLARISSSRHHRKFKDLLLHYLDLDGRRRICYGTDGQSQQYEDTAMLNYRKVEAWDLLAGDVVEFISKYDIDGIHLDNGQAWPQIMELDLEEMFRADVDGEPAYSSEEIMNGEVVVRNENYGYWNSNAMENYANPFFVKLCRQIWAKNPNFMVLGECWGGFMFEHRQIILARSGVIPRLYKMPQTLCSILGKKLSREGRLVDCEKKDISTLKKWYEDSRFCMPEGYIQLQSSTAHQWPYPALMYGQAAWAAVDLLYFMPDIPITFMDETKGERYRLETLVSYQAEKKEVKTTGLKRTNSQLRLLMEQGSKPQDGAGEESDYEHEEAKGLGVRKRSASNLHALLEETKEEEKREPSEAEESEELDLEEKDDDKSESSASDSETIATKAQAKKPEAKKSESKKPDAEPDRKRKSEKKLPDSKSAKEKTKEELAPKKSEKSKKALPKKQDKKTAKKKKPVEEKPVDLSQIKTHYEHRRMLRKQKKVLRYGEMATLRAQDENSVNSEMPWLPDIMAYARYTLSETAIIATNLSNKTHTFYLDLSKLRATIGDAVPVNQVVMATSLLEDPEGQSKTDYFFLREFLSITNWQTLKPYESSVMTITVVEEDNHVFQQALQRSIDRTIEKLAKGQNVEAEQISQLLVSCLETRSTDVAYFANLVGGIQNAVLGKIHMSLNDLFINNKALATNPLLCSRLVALCKAVSKVAETASNEDLKKIKSPVDAARKVFQKNKLGPIVFCTPELGKWSTVGGLGVMVDELSVGLADLGQDVYVISPYYEKNKKGVTGYLAQDGFRYIENIEVQADERYTLGVHEGVVNGVKLVFLHNAEIFPKPYPELQAYEQVRVLTVFGKACLEYACKRQMIPSVCITNDWFTGFIPAYAKTGHFGQTFRGTSFLHICHNLQESYEGRIYPEHRDGILEHIHGLPRDCLVDPNWQLMLNPSRCAIMMSDQWATVSKSYRDDLLNSSPLAPLLRRVQRPFAFPNGVPIEARLKKLDDQAPDHITAKARLQKKYFGFADFDDTVPLFAFVGRITEQKGVHLILEAAEVIIQQYSQKVQFLVGGPGNMNDPYSAGCAHKMWFLKQQYPRSFWAAPEEFFTDGALVNRGTDFGLMPSLFEPGGIVQHEFFVGSTPVIAFKTGGLKDSVIEFNWDNDTGSGFSFEGYSREDFVYAIERAIGTFRNKQKYAKLRANAFHATMSGERVSKAWLEEFFRLKRKVYTDFEELKRTEATLSDWTPSMYQPVDIFLEMFGSEKRQLLDAEDLDFGADPGQPLVSPSSANKKKITSEFDRSVKKVTPKTLQKEPHTFYLHNWGPRHHQVQLCGSFDNWKVQHNMKFDHITNQWFITLHLVKGEHFYKYVLNTNMWIVNDEEPQRKDKDGNINNYFEI